MMKDREPVTGPDGRPGGADEEDPAFRARQIRYALLLPPPRKLPLLLALSLILTPYCLTGIALFAFGLFFAAAFVQPTGIYKQALLRFCHPVTAPGQVLASFDTNLGIGGDDREGVIPVYGCDYTFTTPEGTFPGLCYTNGQVFQVGDQVTVQYLPGRPEISQIRGTRPVAKGWVLAVFPLLLPLLGLIQVAVQTRSGLGKARLLETGRQAQARAVGVRDTGREENHEPIYEVSFQYQSQSGVESSFSYRTRTPGIFTDEPSEVIFYDPERLSQAVPIDALPVEVSPAGQWQVRSPLLAVLKVAAALACLAPYAGYGVWLWLRK